MYNEILGAFPLFIEELFFGQIAHYFTPSNEKFNPIEVFNKEKDLFLKTDNSFLLSNKEKQELLVYNSDNRRTDEAYVFVLRVQGVMYPYKYAYYMQEITRAENDPNVTGIAIIYETPGGSGYNLYEMGHFLANLKKPYYALMKVACSAGYWMAASNPEKMMIANEVSVVGSIGTMTKYINFDGYFQKVLKSQIETIYAPKSKKKNDMGRKMSKGDDSAYKDWLTFHNNKFLDHVAKYRDIKDNDEPTEGGLYYGQDAVVVRLADAMMDEKDFFNLVSIECHKHYLKNN